MKIKKSIIDFFSNSIPVDKLITDIVIGIFLYVLVLFIQDILKNEYYLLYKQFIDLIVLLIVIFYFKKIVIFIIKLFTSRFDLVLSIVITLVLFVSSKNIVFVDFLYILAKGYLFVVMLFVLLLPVLIFLYFDNKKKEKSESLFLSDSPVKSNGDKLGVKKQAEVFAEQVFNSVGSLGDSGESIVFGVEAPWGSGKTSFINICKELWKKDKREPIVVDFEPNNLDIRKDIFLQFENAVIREINKYRLYPELDKSFTGYLSSIGVSWNGFKIDKELSSSCNEKDKLVEHFEIIGKRIIVIIDDLDRMSLDQIKPVTEIVKKYFDISYFTFVLCYSIDNLIVLDEPLKKSISYISNQEIDNKPKTIDECSSKLELEKIVYEEYQKEKIREYFEKIVNVKVSIIVDREKLKNYFISSLLQKLKNNFKEISYNNYDVKYAKEDIEYIFNQQFDVIYPYVSDVRKIKRIVNHILVLFGDANFLKLRFKYFIYLVLIYINYPDLFNEIYQLENYRNGFFSMQYNFSSDGQELYERFENSDYYKNRLNTLPKKTKDLLNLIFCRKNFIDEVKKDSLNFEMHPAINGEYGFPKNLNQYLKVIVRQERPIFVYNTILGKWNDFSNDDKELTLIINNFSVEDENISIKFFGYVNKNVHLLSKEKSLVVIKYLIENMFAFSVIEYSDNNMNYGLRVDSANILIRMIDNIHDSGEISKLIFDESNILGKNRLINLFIDDRNVLGWYDLLLFRLLCSQDRMNDYWNVYEALKIDVKDEIEKNNEVKYLAEYEMRRISWDIFKLFKNEFIEKNLNFIDEIYNLSNIELFGTESKYKYAEKYLEQNELKKIIQKTKLSITSFLAYQLSNNIIDAGVGIGFYNDLDDGINIREKINRYLFDVCFDTDAEKNIGYFLDYILAHLELDHISNKFVPSIKNYERIFIRERLLDYWINNKMKIKEYFNNLWEDRIIYTNNYSASYKEDLPTVFNLLNYESEFAILVERDRFVKALSLIKEKKG